MLWIGLAPARPHHLSRVIHQKYVCIYRQRNKVDRQGQRKELGKEGRKASKAAGLELGCAGKFTDTGEHYFNHI